MGSEVQVPPTHATALHWEHEGNAKILAQGVGPLAARLQDLAERHQILVLQDFELSRHLSRLPVGSQIPDPVFTALAVILEFLQKETDRGMPDNP